MKARRAVLVLAAVALVGLALVGYRALRTRTRLVAGDGFRGVIFGQRAAERALGFMVMDDDTVYWTPTRSQILALEARLRAHVARQQPELAARLPDYRRQYLGFTRQGARRVYVVGFCESDALDWRHEFVSTAAMEGLPQPGGCHFEAEYDMMTEGIVFFWVLEE